MDPVSVAVVTIVGLSAVAGGMYAWIWPRSRRERVVHDFAAKRQLVLHGDAAGLAERLLVATRRGRFLGGQLGVVTVFGAWWATRTHAVGLSWGGVFVASSAAGFLLPQVTGTLGAALAARRAHPEDGAHRVAHVPAPSLDDYLPPLMRWYPAALLAVSGVAVAAVIVTWPHLAPMSVGRRGLAGAWLASLAAIAATELAARAVVRMPRRAASPAALAVHDEITSDLVVVVIAGALGPGLLLGLVATAVAPAGFVAGCWLSLVPALAETRRRHRVRDRLWRLSTTHPGVASAMPPEGAP